MFSGTLYLISILGALVEVSAFLPNLRTPARESVKKDFLPPEVAHHIASQVHNMQISPIIPHDPIEAVKNIMSQSQTMSRHINTDGFPDWTDAVEEIVKKKAEGSSFWIESGEKQPDLKFYMQIALVMTPEKLKSAPLLLEKHKPAFVATKLMETIPFSLWEKGIQVHLMPEYIEEKLFVLRVDVTGVNAGKLEEWLEENNVSKGQVIPAILFDTEELVQKRLLKEGVVIDVHCAQVNKESNTFLRNLKEATKFEVHQMKLKGLLGLKMYSDVLKLRAMSSNQKPPEQ